MTVFHLNPSISNLADSITSLMARVKHGDSIVLLAQTSLCISAISQQVCQHCAIAGIAGEISSDMPDNSKLSLLNSLHWYILATDLETLADASKDEMTASIEHLATENCAIDIKIITDEQWLALTIAADSVVYHD